MEKYAALILASGKGLRFGGAASAASEVSREASEVSREASRESRATSGGGNAATKACDTAANAKSANSCGLDANTSAALPKQFIEIDSKPIILHSLNAFCSCGVFSSIVVVVSAKDEEYWLSLCKKFNIDSSLVRHCIGGSTRFESVFNGLKFLSKLQDPAEKCFVAVHDGVRPLVKPSFICSCLDFAKTNGNAIPCLVPSESFRIMAEAAGGEAGGGRGGTSASWGGSENGCGFSAAGGEAAAGGAAVLGSSESNETRTSDDWAAAAHKSVQTSKIINRDLLRSIQTPQIARLATLLAAFKKASLCPSQEIFTDEASVLEYYGEKISLCQGQRDNIKITYPEDYEICAYLLQKKNNSPL